MFPDLCMMIPKQQISIYRVKWEIVGPAVLGTPIFPIQLESQDPQMEVPTILSTIYKAYVRGYTPQNMALYATVPPF